MTEAERNAIIDILHATQRHDLLVGFVHGAPAAVELQSRLDDIKQIAEAALASDPVKAAAHQSEEFQFSVGDYVQKARGYKWPGIVVGRFTNLAGKVRYVVECTVPEVADALHIYSATDLVRSDPVKAADDWLDEMVRPGSTGAKS